MDSDDFKERKKKGEIVLLIYEILKTSYICAYIQVCNLMLNFSIQTSPLPLSSRMPRWSLVTRFISRR